MKKDDDQKGMLNEVLPDPTQAADAKRGTPRERTSEHLRRVLSAAAGVALGLHGAAHADVTPPKGKGEGDKKPTDTQKAEPKPDPPGYGVVDPIPEPYVDRNAGKPGTLKVITTPAGATVTVDGKASGKTPVSKIKLTPGIHAITLTLKDVVENFTVDVRPGANLVESRDMRPKPPTPPPAPPK
jgi:hypothetical protein